MLDLHADEAINAVKRDDDLFNHGLCWFERIAEDTTSNPRLYTHECIMCKQQLVSTERDVADPIPCTRAMTVSEMRADNGIKVPSIVKRLGNFGIAYLRHLASGLHVATQEEINQRFSRCYQSPSDFCARYVDGKCLDCGCYVNTVPADKGLNKLAWKESECPKGRW